MDTDNKPRNHHYIYAHRWLPSIAFGTPDVLHNIASGPRLNEFLTDMWTDLGKRLPDSERMPDEQISGQLRQSGAFEVVIVTLPAPATVTEAYFTAIAFGPLATLGFSADTTQKLPVRYLTLEFGFTMPDDPPRTVLGEWTREQAHYNMGTGPEPTADAFFEAVCARIKGQ
jgi:hypothetical protein